VEESLKKLGPIGAGRLAQLAQLAATKGEPRSSGYCKLLKELYPADLTRRAAIDALKSAQALGQRWFDGLEIAAEAYVEGENDAEELLLRDLEAHHNEDMSTYVRNALAFRGRPGIGRLVLQLAPRDRVCVQSVDLMRRLGVLADFLTPLLMRLEPGGEEACQEALRKTWVTPILGEGTIVRKQLGESVSALVEFVPKFMPSRRRPWFSSRDEVGDYRHGEILDEFTVHAWYVVGVISTWIHGNWTGLHSAILVARESAEWFQVTSGVIHGWQGMYD
jgi:hypothetical protein